MIIDLTKTFAVAPSLKPTKVLLDGNTEYGWSITGYFRDKQSRYLWKDWEWKTAPDKYEDFYHFKFSPKDEALQYIEAANLTVSERTEFEDLPCLLCICRGRYSIRRQTEDWHWHWYRGGFWCNVKLDFSSLEKAMELAEELPEGTELIEYHTVQEPLPQGEGIVPKH